jgi:hypothetical protein
MKLNTEVSVPGGSVLVIALVLGPAMAAPPRSYHRSFTKKRFVISVRIVASLLSFPGQLPLEEEVLAYQTVRSQAL